MYLLVELYTDRRHCCLLLSQGPISPINTIVPKDVEHYNTIPQATRVQISFSGMTTVQHFHTYPSSVKVQLYSLRRLRSDGDVPIALLVARDGEDEGGGAPLQQLVDVPAPVHRLPVDGCHNVPWPESCSVCWGAHDKSVDEDAVSD